MVKVRLIGSYSPSKSSSKGSVALCQEGEKTIYKRKDGRWEGRYIKSLEKGKIHYCYVYGKNYREAKQKNISCAQNSVIPVVQDVPELPTGTFGPAVSRNQLNESSYVKYRTVMLDFFKQSCD